MLSKPNQSHHSKYLSNMKLQRDTEQIIYLKEYHLFNFSSVFLTFNKNMKLLFCLFVH